MPMDLVYRGTTNNPLVIDRIVVAQRDRDRPTRRHTDLARLEMRVVEADRRAIGAGRTASGQQHHERDHAESHAKRRNAPKPATAATNVAAATGATGSSGTPAGAGRSSPAAIAEGVVCPLASIARSYWMSATRPPTP